MDPSPEVPILISFDSQLPAADLIASILGKLRDEAYSRLTRELGKQWGEEPPVVQRAMLAERMLDLVLDEVDYVVASVKGQIVSLIERERLWAFLPPGYSSLEDMLVQKGKSLTGSQASDYRCLTEHVFPFVAEHGIIPPNELWKEAGPSKLRLVAGPCRDAIQSDRTTEEKVEMVSGLLAAATQQPWRELRQALQSPRVEALNITAVRYGDRFKLEILADEAQVSFLRRKLGTRANWVTVTK